jgi:TonB family protein
MLHGMAITSLWLFPVTKMKEAKTSGQNWEIIGRFDIRREHPHRSLPRPDWGAVPRKADLPKIQEPLSAPPTAAFIAKPSNVRPVPYGGEPPMMTVPLGEKQPSRMGISAEKPKISVRGIETKDSVENQFNDYFLEIREKIRERISVYGEDIHLRGEIYVTFVVLANGALKDVRVEDKGSGSSDHLRRIALRSVKEASPVPPFPKGLDYQELSCSLPIAVE